MIFICFYGGYYKYQKFGESLMLKNSIFAHVLLGLVVIMLLSFASLLTGAGIYGVEHSLAYLTGDKVAMKDANLVMVIESLRAPRTVIAILVGIALGVSATLMQNVTRNPLAEPGLLGVNAGAALGVVLGISFAEAESAFSYLVWALIGAGIANLLVIIVAQARSHSSPFRLILAGMAITATFVALTNFLLLSFVNTLDQFQYWTMGSLSGGQIEMVYTVGPAILLGTIFAFMMSRPLSAMLLGDDSAAALGFEPSRIRLKIVIITTILSASAVAMTGPIGFLGLIAAYLGRGVVGASVAKQIITSALIGAIVLLFADILSRVVARPFETPVSVLIAMLGAPLLVWVVRSNRLMSMSSSTGN